jgi:superoxide dismutase, Cu-Zn family
LRHSILPIVPIVSALAILACASEQAKVTPDSAVSGPAPAPPAATASSASSAQGSVAVRDASGRELGTLAIDETPSGLAVTGSLVGLAPGEHGIHFHTTGKCEAPFESAGGHWNPANRQHGATNPQGPHLGDLSNITVGADSTATVSVTSPGGTLRGANALLDADGAALVIHAAADDNRTDPSGNSGARIACGVAAT